MAMGIFIIGFTMIMAIFPAAILIQKRTIDDVQARNVAWNARAILEARPIDQADLVAGLPVGFDTDQQVYPLPPGMLPNVSVGGVQEWMLGDRSYPANIADPQERRFYWVPMVQDANPAPNAYDWRVFVFVLRRGEELSYDKGSGTWANPNDPDGIPGVIRVGSVTRDNDTTLQFDNDPDTVGRAALVRAGDWMLDSNGVIYTVSKAEPGEVVIDGYIPASAAPSAIWIGRPSPDGGRSPCQRIILVSGVVQ